MGALMTEKKKLKDEDGKPAFYDTPDDDLPELSAAELAQLKAEVEKEIEKELKAEAKKRHKERIRNELRQQKSLDEPLEQVVIDVPAYVGNILIDNVIYMPGQVATVRRGVAIFMREMMQRCWQHQSEIDGHRKDFYRKQKSLVLGPSALNASAAQILHA
jgi:hypothetical protein